MIFIFKCSRGEGYMLFFNELQRDTSYIFFMRFLKNHYGLSAAIFVNCIRHQSMQCPLNENMIKCGMILLIEYDMT